MLIMRPSTRNGDMSKKGFRGFKFSVLGFKAYMYVMYVWIYERKKPRKYENISRGSHLHVVEMLCVNVKAQVSLNVPTQGLWHVNMNTLVNRASIDAYKNELDATSYTQIETVALRTYDVQAKDFLQISSEVQEERRVLRVRHRLGIG